MIIDCNMHWLPPELLTDDELMEAYLNQVPRAYGDIAYTRMIPGTDVREVVIEKPAGCINLNFGPETIDPEDRIKVMNEGKIDKAILKVPCFQEWLTLEQCIQVNDGMKKYADEHGQGRMERLGVIPPWGTKAMLGEMDRCVKELGCIGFEASAHYGTLYLDEEPFREFFRKAAELGVPVNVHHTPLPVQYDKIVINDTFRRIYGRCQDQTIAVGREIFSDLFEELPNLKLIHTLLGGGFFAIADFIAPKRSKVKEEIERLDLSAAEKARKHLQENIYFDISHAPPWGKAQLECAVKVLGADHLLFGCSYPVRKQWLIDGVDFINALDVSQEEKDLILGKNARNLFNIS